MPKLDIHPAGSSPQARGTPRVGIPGWRKCRLIPAGAGNTLQRKRMGVGVSAHPRRRGEHTRSLVLRSGRSGSSPQARGTRRASRPSAPSGRLIPAGAGNTTSSPICSVRHAAHPRRRGEHIMMYRAIVSPDGSSPQARGTHPEYGAALEYARLIPAGAGNTRYRRSPPRSTTAHPRRRGEHPGLARRVARPNGSSPQARGTRRAPAGVSRLPRLIPAGAGNTPKRTGCRARTAAHPRRRGEHKRRDGDFSRNPGSSPQARGTRGQERRELVQRRLIPAGAGNTHSPQRSRRSRPAHPRRRGEHLR